MDKNKALIITFVILVAVLAGLGLWNSKNKVDKIESQTSPSSEPTITQPDPNNAGMTKVPDISVSAVPTSAISVKYLIEHRSALNGKTVRVQGYVVNSWADPSKCSPYMEMLCPRPVIFLADGNQPSSNPYYDLYVRLSEEDTSYFVGQEVEIKGTVSASADSVQLIKSY